MPIILVFGASGQVGRFLLPRLSPQHRVIAASRAAHAGHADWIRADLGDQSVVWPAVDAVISLGPLDAFATWLERYPASTLRRVIALSSMSAQSKQNSADPHERALSERLRAAEACVARVAAERGIACTVFRPTLIYGAGRDRSLAPIARFAGRWRILPVPRAASGLRQPVHARDLANACLAAFDNAATFGKTYELGGGERLRFDAMLLRLRNAVSCRVLPIPVPLIALRLIAACWKGSAINAAMLARLQEPLIADNTAAISDFGYAPATFAAQEVLPQW